MTTAFGQVLPSRDVGAIIGGDPYAQDVPGGVLIWDDFSTHGNLTPPGKPLIGPSWGVTGADLPIVTNGLLGSSTSTGYTYADCGADRPQTLSCGVRWVNADTNKTATMAWVTGPTGTPIEVTDIGVHFNFGPTGFTISFRQASAFTTLLTADWSTPMVSGVTYAVSVRIHGDQVTVSARGSTHTSAPDPRVSALSGPIVFWETNVVSTATAQFAWVLATKPDTTTPPVLAAIAGLSSVPSSSQRGQVTGNKEQSSEVTVGIAKSDSLSPGVSFGAALVRTHLVNPVAIAATTMTVPEPLTTGTSVVFEGGSNAETLTTTGFPSGSTGAYVVTLTSGFTKAHAAGTVVLATPTAAYQAQMYLSLGNGFFYLPALSVLCVPNGNLYLGSQLDTFIKRYAADTAGMAAGDSWQTDGTWNGGHTIMGAYHLWVDTSARLRIKSGAPTSETDGTVVGTQT